MHTQDPVKEDTRKALIKEEEARLGARINEHHADAVINAAMEADLARTHAIMRIRASLSDMCGTE